MQQVSDSAVNRLQRLILEITAYQEELRLLQDNGRITGVSDLQRYGDAAERWRSELDRIRGAVPAGLRCEPMPGGSPAMAITIFLGPGSRGPERHPRRWTRRCSSRARITI